MLQDTTAEQCQYNIPEKSLHESRDRLNLLKMVHVDFWRYLDSITWKYCQGSNWYRIFIFFFFFFIFVCVHQRRELSYFLLLGRWFLKIEWKSNLSVQYQNDLVENVGARKEFQKKYKKWKTGLKGLIWIFSHIVVNFCYFLSLRSMISCRGARVVELIFAICKSYLTWMPRERLWIAANFSAYKLFWCTSHVLFGSLYFPFFNSWILFRLSSIRHWASQTKIEKFESKFQNLRFHFLLEFTFSSGVRASSALVTFMNQHRALPNSDNLPYTNSNVTWIYCSAGTCL